MIISSSLGSRLETVATLIQDITEMAYTCAWKLTENTSRAMHHRCQGEINRLIGSLWRAEQEAVLYGTQEGRRMFWSAHASIEWVTQSHKRCFLVMVAPWPGTHPYETITVAYAEAEVLVSLGIARCITEEQSEAIDAASAHARASGEPFVWPDIEWREGVFEVPQRDDCTYVVVVLVPWEGVSLHEIVRVTLADAKELVENGWARAITMEQADILMAQQAMVTHPRPRFHGELRNACLIHRAGKRVKAG